jgi:hypothetical protein
MFRVIFVEGGQADGHNQAVSSWFLSTATYASMITTVEPCVERVATFAPGGLSTRAFPAFAYKQPVTSAPKPTQD